MQDLQPEEYAALAEFRYQIRRFLHFSEQAAAGAGVETRQHQLMLAVKALSRKKEPTISDLAEHLQRQHHSVVGLVDRLEHHGLVKRSRGENDKRQVLVRLTPEGDSVLRRLSLAHRAELRTAGPALLKILNRLMPPSEVVPVTPLEEMAGGPR